ncbi:MAG TPA: EAL domain-containing protein [Allosphingosinicella sp.]
MIEAGRTQFADALSAWPTKDRAPGQSMSFTALQAQEEESRRQLQSVLTCLSGLFYRCELQAPWTMSFISHGIEELTGYSAPDIQRMNGWEDIIAPQDRDSVKEPVARAISGRHGFDLSYRIRHSGGGLRWVRERGHAVYDDSGTPLFLEGVITDISGRKHAEELQHTLTARWRTTLDSIPQMVWTMAGDGSEEFYNSQWLAFTGLQVGGEAKTARLELVHPDDREAARAAWSRSFGSGEPYEAQYRLRHVSGEYRWVLSRGWAEIGEDGRPARWYGTCTDIHQQFLAQEALKASEDLNRSMIEASPDCISLLDIRGHVRFVNTAAMKALGLSSSAPLLGKPWADAFPPSARGPAQLAVAHAMAGKNGHFGASQSHTSGTRWWDVIAAPIHAPGGGQSGILTIARDITHQKTAEDRVRWAGNHDALTHLPNRTLFQRGLDQQIHSATTDGGAFTVLMLDLDEFKRTNDALGHDAGDALLAEFAARLRKSVRKDDVVARLGGDEFAVVLNGVGEEQEVEDAVAAVLRDLRAPFVFDGKVLDIRASVGASIFPGHGTTRSELLKHADIALYSAKASGRGVLKVFEPAMRAETQNRLSMLSLAKDALADNRILPFYQPKLDVASGALDGFEALLRWRHPVRGIQTPDTIAAAFQDAVLAPEISDRMIDCVIADMRDWRDRAVPFDHVAINAAAAEFRRGDFADRLLERLHRAGLPTSSLQLEVTETVFLGRGSEHVEKALRTLSAAGVQIALDDFGTGYASLSHLNHFPVDVIKIDRSFIRNIEANAHDAAIVRAVIKLGRSLGIKIVAEGVENVRQAAFLRKQRCHSAQGFLFGRPMPADLVEAFARGATDKPV